jgi:hypothetical protein
MSEWELISPGFNHLPGHLTGRSVALAKKRYLLQNATRLITNLRNILFNVRHYFYFSFSYSSPTAVEQRMVHVKAAR